MKIKAQKCEVLNYFYNNREKEKKNEIKKKNNVNYYEQNKIKALFSKFSENERDNLKYYLDNIIKNESKNTLNYNNLENASINQFEMKRKLILKLLMKYFEKKFNNFTDLYIFQMINIIDRYIYTNFIEMNEENFNIIIQATFKIVSKFDKLVFKYDSDEVNKAELDIMLKLNFNFHFISTYEILDFIWKIIVNNSNKNQTYYLTLLFIILSLFYIELLKYDKVSLAIASLFLACDMTDYNIDKNNINLLFNYNTTKINSIKKIIEQKLKLVLKDKTFEFLFEKFDSSKYLEVGKIFKA